jgi:hypothetical protein
MKYKIVYTCSNNNKMLEELKYSILSARRFIDKESIEVMFTPEIPNLDVIHSLQKICNVRIYNKNINGTWAIHPEDPNNPRRHYGDKIYLCDTKAENVLFLDCDTIIYNDPSKLFEGDFDFAGMATDTYPWMWQYKSNRLSITKRVYKLHSDDVHMWDGGTLVFKNNCHKKIKEDWLRYYNDRDMMDYCMQPNRKTYDQTSLVPVIHKHNLKTKVLSEDEVMKCKLNWKDRMSDNNIILHGNYIWKKLNMEKELENVWENLM